jgi:hypothetical protein
MTEETRVKEWPYIMVGYSALEKHDENKGQTS